MNPAVAYVGDYSYLLDDLASKAKKRYLVAVQSGKPVLDEELTEIGYRNLDFLRRYLERNVGDAVLDGDRTAVLESDAVPGRSWRVEQSSLNNVNNFVVKGGTTEKPAILVLKGYPLLLFSDIEYNLQNNSGSLEEDDYTNTSIQTLSPPPSGTRTDAVYVDFYLAEVSSEVGSEYQDTSIKNTDLNLQSANRWRLVQDILVATGTTSIPADGLDSNNIYHRYYKLAEITRTAGVNTILSADITDKRTYVNTLENLSNGKGELNVFNATVRNDLNVYGTMTIINQSETNSEKLMITCNDDGVDALSIVKTLSGKGLNINKSDAGYALDVTSTGSDDAIHVQKTGTGYGIHVDAGSILLDNGTDLFYNPSIEGVNSLRTHVNNQLALLAPTGFPNRTDSTISFNNATRTFTIAPTATNFTFYINNTAYTRTAESIVISDTEGLWFFYYNHSGVLTASQSPWDLTQHAPISYIYWDSTNDQAIALAEERHGTIMDGMTHTYLHFTFGTQYYTGFGLSGTIGGTGGADADAQIAIANGTIFDEDLRITITNGSGSNFFEQQLSPIAYVPIWYRSGSLNWRIKTATTFPVYNGVGSGRIGFNQNNAGSWGVTEVADGYYVPMFFFATNDTNNPIIAILGQTQHATLLDAQTNSGYQLLALGTLPFQELKILFRVIFQTNSSYANTAKARIVDMQDLRATSNAPSGSYVPTEHGSLSGLADQDHPASAIYTSFSNFNGALTAADSDVQKALDTLDDIWKRLSPASSNTDDLYRTGDVIIGTNTASTDAKLLVADTLGSNHRTRIKAIGTPTAQSQYGGQLYLSADIRDVVIASVVETLIGTETWAANPKLGVQINTLSPSGAVNALRITYDGRFGFGTQTVVAGYRAQVQGNLYVTGNEQIDGTLTVANTTTFNGSVNYSTQTPDRIALIDSSKNLVSSTVTLAELQVLNNFVENVQDITGGMVSSNTENGIVVTYDDANGKLNFDVNDPVLTINGDATGSATMTNLGNTTITITLTTESVQDIVGEMVSNNTENGIVVTYDDANGKLNFDVNDPVITLNGDVTGSATMTNLGNTTIAVTLVAESVQDIVGAMVSSNIENGIAVTYDDPNGKLNFDVNDFTITLSGDCSGSVVITNLASATLSITVLDDSHTHDTRYYTESESDARFMNVSGDSAEGIITFPAVNTAIANASGSLADLQVYGTGTGAAFMMFHRPGSYAMYLGLDTDNQLKIGGWSMGANSYKVWSAFNHGHGSGLDADTLDGLQLSGTTNNAANQVVRTDGSGFVNFGWINTISGAAASSTALVRIYASNDAYIRYYTPADFWYRLQIDGGSAYNVRHTWLRYMNDATNVKLYGGSRQMVFRTDGVAEYSGGIGEWPYVFMYNGDAAANRIMILNSDGTIWTPTYGWLHTYFAAAGHWHDNSTLSNIDWSKILNKPDPVITLTGGVTGSGTMTDVGSVTITVAVADDSHKHTILWSTSHPYTYYISNYWTGSRWRIITNHSDAVSVAHADYADSSNYSNSAGSATWLGSHAFATDTGVKIQLNGTSTFGGTLKFGDGDYAFITEDSDDHLWMYARLGVTIDQLSGSYADLNGTFAGSFSGYANITGGSLSGISYSGDITSSNAQITGGSISGTSITPSGDLYIAGNSSGTVALTIDNAYWSCDFASTVLRFKTSHFQPSVWHEINHNSCQNKLELRSTTDYGGTMTTHLTVYGGANGYVNIPTLGGVINASCIFKYSQGGIYGVYTNTIDGVGIYRTIVLDADTGSVFYVNSDNYPDTRWNEVVIIGGTVGQVIWIMNSAWNHSNIHFMGNNTTRWYMATYDLWDPNLNPSRREIQIFAGGAVALMKVTDTETRGLWGRANVPQGAGHRGLWVLMSAPPGPIGRNYTPKLSTITYSMYTEIDTVLVA